MECRKSLPGFLLCLALSRGPLSVHHSPPESCGDWLGSDCCLEALPISKKQPAQISTGTERGTSPLMQKSKFSMKESETKERKNTVWFRWKGRSPMRGVCVWVAPLNTERQVLPNQRGEDSKACHLVIHRRASFLWS